MNPDETEDESAATPKSDRTLPVFRGSESELIDAMKRLAGELQIESIPQEAWAPLAKYCLLVWDWNAKMNLTRHTTPELFVKRDLLDSVELAKCLRPNEEVLDIGTGVECLACWSRSCDPMCKSRCAIASRRRPMPSKPWWMRWD